jgi:hypothetical protein
LPVVKALARFDRDGGVADLLSQRPDATQTPSEQRSAVPGPCQGAGSRFANARRGAGDDRDAAGGLLSVVSFVIGGDGLTVASIREL